MRALTCENTFGGRLWALSITNPMYSCVNEASILAVQVFDQKKFKKKDQGFLGVINIRIGDVMPELGPDADGTPWLQTLLQATGVADADTYI